MAQVHAGVSASVIYGLESYRFCKEGDARHFIQDGPAIVFFATVRYHLGNRAALGKRMAVLRKAFEITAQWDGEAGVWWCSNDELPLTTEAPTFDQLVARALEIAPEIAAENGLAAPGDEIELHVVAERVQRVPVVAAA